MSEISIDDFQVPEDDVPAVKTAKTKAAPEIKYAWQRKYPKAKLVKIILDENDEIPPTGLFVNINDDSFVIVAGEEVEVPDFLVSHLDNCVKSMPVIDPNTRQVLSYRDRARFTYRVVR